LFIFVSDSLSFHLDDNDEKLFREFIIKYDKHYRTPIEEEQRFGIFRKNVETIRMLNNERKEPTDAYHTINEFSDLLDEELPIYFPTNLPLEIINSSDSFPQIDPRDDKRWNKIPDLPEGNHLPEHYAFCGEYVKQNKDRPKIDFCGKAVSQGKCSCCWATSLVNLGQYIYSNLTYERYGCIKTPPIFSVQRFLDVTKTKASKRCCGGNPKDAMDAVPSFSLANDYPFIDSSNSNGCSIRGDQNPNVQLQMSINGYKTFGIRHGEDKVLILKKLLHHYGPFLVSIKVAGTNFNSYSSGIFEFPNGPICDTTSPKFMTDHEVVLMGWGKENGIEYFIIRNSWGTGWGEGDNYMRIKTTNLCGIGWRIGDNVYPLNMLIFANTCKFDKNCKECNINTNKCNKCFPGYEFNSNNQCVSPQ
jgi:cysteine proteinase